MNLNLHLLSSFVIFSYLFSILFPIIFISKRLQKGPKTKLPKAAPSDGSMSTGSTQRICAEATTSSSSESRTLASSFSTKSRTSAGGGQGRWRGGGKGWEVLMKSCFLCFLSLGLPKEKLVIEPIKMETANYSPSFVLKVHVCFFGGEVRGWICIN